MNSKEAEVFSLTYTPVAPVDHWSAKKKAEWANNRRFYSCNPEQGEIDVMKYMLDPEKSAKPSEELLREQAAARLHIDLSDRVPNKNEARRIDDYMTRFNTLGAFDLDGVMTKAECDEWRREAQKTKATLYHGVVSLPDKLSSYVGYEDMEMLVRQTFGGFLKKAGFDPDNVALMCAMHDNTENKHFHFTFYEKAPKYLDKYGFRHFREKWNIDKQLLREYRMSATAYLDRNKRELSNYRNATIRQLHALNIVPTDRELYVALRSLEDKLPKRGRLQYNSENIAPFRKEIDDIAQMLLRKSPDALESHRKTLREIARRGAELAETGTKNNYAKRLTAEYKSRLGNVVLGMVKQFRTNPKSSVRGKPGTRRQYKAAARHRRERGARVIKFAIGMVDGGPRSVQADFTQNLKNAEREIEYENITANKAKHNRS